MEEIDHEYLLYYANDSRVVGRFNSLELLLKAVTDLGMKSYRYTVVKYIISDQGV